MKKIILASTSPRRRELLSKLNIDFEVVSPSFDEDSFKISTNPLSIENLSLLKAKSISTKLTVSAFVISADTVVICDNKIMGKPKSEEEAFFMLKTLSGNTHHVITGVAVIDTEKSKEYSAHGITYVTFNDLSDEDIMNYIKDKKPFDKAGAYGIQELPDNFVKMLDGEFDNVMGLPTKILINMLKSIN
ncbi:MAG: Maf family protein [Candidatus Gastranaerophilaceae bacterium]